MTPAAVAQVDDTGTAEPRQPQPMPSTPPAARGRPRQGSETSLTDTTHAGDPLRRTASSRLTMDSAERVYACILASPLERARPLPSPQEQEPVPVRDDVGWPLPPGENT
ncbi:hypothetical protein VTH82DRAFT_4659 [Thermothelomyces myriococcoides]